MNLQKMQKSAQAQAKAKAEREELQAYEAAKAFIAEYEAKNGKPKKSKAKKEA